MVKKIYKQGIVILPVLAALSALLDWKIWPLSIAVGGLLGQANLKAMVWGIEGLVSSPRASGVLIFFSMLRLIAVCIILVILLSFRLVNILGVIGGFTVVFALVIKEGMAYAKEDQ